jgi:hypothetical protein
MTVGSPFAGRCRREARRSLGTMDGVPAETEEALVRRWISDTFGTVDPSALMGAERRPARRLAGGRDGRSVIEEKVFIILQAALDQQRVSTSAVDQLARMTVQAVRRSSTDRAPMVVESLLRQWKLPPDRLAHAVRVVTQVASEQ